LAEQLCKEENTYLRDRFFNQSYQYFGLRSLDEVTACLGAFDNALWVGDTEYPAPTKEILPDAYQGGWRMANLGPVIWETYVNEYKRPLKLESWGMEYFSRAITILLNDYLPNYELNDENVYTMVSHSLEASGLESSLIEVQ